MKYTRRAVLGSIIGTIVASGLPFIVKEPIFEPLAETALDRFKQYKMLHHCSLGDFWVDVKEVTFKDGKIIFTAEDICVNLTLTSTGVSLFKPSGENELCAIGEKSWNSSVPLISQDILKISYTLGIGGVPIDTPEQFELLLNTPGLLSLGHKVRYV